MSTTKKPKTTTTAWFNWDRYLYPYEENFDEDDFVFGRDNIETLEYWGIRVLDVAEQIYEIAVFINLFVNLPHLIILLQKELRTNLVYIIMIGICLCDLAHSIGKIVSIFMKWNIVYTLGKDCLEGFKYYHVVINLVAKTIQITSRRCSGFLALFIAVFRAFSVIFPMSNAVNFLMKAKSGYFIVFLLGLFCSGWGSAYFVQAKIMYSRWCPMPNENDNYPIFFFISSELWELKYRIIDSCVSLVISFVYIIVAIALVIALFSAQKRRKNLKSEKSNNTRALVITMAVSLFLCETVYGTVFILDYFVFVDTREQSILEDVDFIAVIFQIINSITHCFVCLLMSSQYRDTVKRLIFWGKEKETKITVPESSAHPTTVQTTKTSNSSRNTF